MLKASQLAVVHNANVNLVGIRNLELGYFNNFFSSFGLQAALIAGFLIGSITQVPGMDAECHPAFTYLYWISLAVSFSTSTHVLVCCVYISVFGQGLALRGPLGSMIRAIDGMVEEQNQILYAFVISIFALALSTIGTYWIMMTPLAGLITTVITLIGMVLWHHYTLRIYNRFKYISETAWREGAAEDDEDQTLILVANHPNHASGAAPTNRGGEHNHESMNNLWQDSKQQKGNTFGAHGNHPHQLLPQQEVNDDPDNAPSPSLSSAHNSSNKVAQWPSLSSLNPFGPSVSSSKNKRDSEGEVTADQRKQPSTASVSNSKRNSSTTSNNNSNNNNNPQNVMYAGFITIKLGSSKMFSKPWRRVFAVVTVTGTCSGGGGGSGSELTYYHDQRTWLDHPEAPLRKRPVELEGMALHVASEEPQLLQPQQLLLSEKEREKAQFDLVLAPVDNENDGRKRLRFRCDTVTEMETWMTVLRRAVEQANCGGAGAVNVGHTTMLAPPEAGGNNRGFAL